jgi:hypothetical protein
MFLCSEPSSPRSPLAPVTHGFFTPVCLLSSLPCSRVCLAFSGKCNPGYFCPAGSTSGTAHPCGDVTVFCPLGSGAPLPVVPGDYTVGPSEATRNSSLSCPSGSYCSSGLRFACPGGRFGCSGRQSESSCDGACAAGFYCGPGSTNAQAMACGGVPSSPGAAAVFCPEGTAGPVAVGVGNYSTGGPANAPHRRTGQAVCPAGLYCQGGVAVSVCVCKHRLTRPCLCASCQCDVSTEMSQGRCGVGRYWARGPWCGPCGAPRRHLQSHTRLAREETNLML